MINFDLNLMEDIFGIFIVFSAFAVCTYNWYSAEIIRQKMLPCEKEISKFRNSAVADHFKSLAANSLVLLFFFFVLVQWLAAKLNTAPDMIDVQVFILKIAISALCVRSSTCAKLAIIKLSTIRDSDINCNKPCTYCPKTKEKEEVHANSGETIPVRKS